MKDERSFYYRHALVCKLKYADITSYLIRVLKQHSFDVQVVDAVDAQILVLSQTNEEKILREAQFSKIKKQFTLASEATDLNLPDEVVKYERMRNYIYTDRNNFVPDETFDELHDRKKTDNRWGLGLFTESEMLYLENNILAGIEICDIEEFIKTVEASELKKKLPFIKNVLLNERSLYHILNRFKVIKEHFPIHNADFKEKILKETVLNFRCPYRKIRSYFNDKVAIYYAWIYHYTRFLSIPCAIVIVFYILDRFIENATKTLLTTYAILLAVWTQLFIVYWNSKCSELSIEWDNYGEEYNKENQRREFKGTWRKSPITEEYEKYYPSSKRKMTYLLSFAVSMPFILFALLLNVCFLNLSGFISPHLESVFEIQFLGQFSEPGRLFAIGTFPNTLIGIFQVIIVQMINKMYQRVAEKTCDWENHRIRSNYENSLILKRFVFEFFDCFFSLFYLAFVTKDIKSLKSTLKSIFIVNEIRRVLTETLIPNIVQYFKGSSKVSTIFKGGNENSMIQGKEIDKKEIIKQFMSPEYETFDDYLEVVLEFGYMTLFAECFPFAPIFVLIVNNIEIRSDILKLSTIYKRPHYFRKRNTGSWQLIIQAISTLSILTNMLFAFMFSSSDIGLKADANGSNHVLSFFVMEHVVFIVIVLIRLTISSTSSWVKLFLERKEYQQKKGKWKALCEKIVTKKTLIQINK